MMPRPWGHLKGEGEAPVGAEPPSFRAGAVSKVRKQDGTVVLIPNSSVIGNKIYLLLQKLTGQQSGQ